MSSWAVGIDPAPSDQRKGGADALHAPVTDNPTKYRRKLVGLAIALLVALAVLVPIFTVTIMGLVRMEKVKLELISLDVVPSELASGGTSFRVRARPNNMPFAHKLDIDSARCIASTENDSAAVLDVAPAKLGSEIVMLDVNLQLNSGVGLVAWRDGLHSELTCVARGRLTSGALRFQVAFEVPQPSSSPCAQTPP